VFSLSAQNEATVIEPSPEETKEKTYGATL